MSDKMHEVGKNAHGVEVSAGYYAIAPDGSLRLLAPSAPLKTGWRLATAEDYDRALAVEQATRAREAAALSPDEAAEQHHIRQQQAEGTSKMAAKERARRGAKAGPPPTIGKEHEPEAPIDER